MLLLISPLSKNVVGWNCSWIEEGAIDEELIISALVERALEFEEIDEKKDEEVEVSENEKEEIDVEDDGEDSEDSEEEKGEKEEKGVLEVEMVEEKTEQSDFKSFWWSKFLLMQIFLQSFPSL